MGTIHSYPLIHALTCAHQVWPCLESRQGWPRPGGVRRHDRVSLVESPSSCLDRFDWILSQGRQLVYKGKVHYRTSQCLQRSHVHCRSTCRRVYHLMLLIASRREQDVDWHATKENILASVGDDKYLMMCALPRSHPSSRIMWICSLAGIRERPPMQ